MAQDPIWPGSGSFDEVTGSVPFGFYTDDSVFISHSVQTAEWCAKRLGYPISEIELQSAQFYTCFEESITEYSAIVNEYNIKENMLALTGATGSQDNTHRSVPQSWGHAIDIAEKYGQEAGVGGNITWHTGSFAVVSGSQDYDLQKIFSSSLATGELSGKGDKRIEIKRVFHQGDPAISRFYDPFAGAGVGSQNLIQEFGFGSYSPAITFTLMPVYADVLRTQMIELSDTVRKSAYSFELINNKLKIFPLPQSDFNMYFQYILKEHRSGVNNASGGKTDVASDFSNIRYDNMQYKNINDPGKQWIRKYTLALSKELLGMVRGKYGSIPIPGGETSMDGDTLRAEATAEKENLVTTLREMLEQATSNELMEEEAQEAQHTQEILSKIPLKIYIG